MSAPNPLLAPWTALHGLPPFAELQPAHFEPALQQAMAAHRSELAALGAAGAAPTFDNTVAAFDRTGRTLDRVASVFYNLSSSATSDALQAAQRKLAAPMAAHHSAIHTDRAFFARLDGLHARREQLGLTLEQQRLLERLHLDFVRSGAQLADAPRRRYAEVMEALAQLTTRFAQNVLHDESGWQLALTSPADLAGLPDFLRAAASQAAVERGLTGHVITLSRSLVVPFLTFSERPDLREKAWRAWTTRGEHAGEHDNREVARDILRLRREQAQLMGHSCYADHALADTMAGTRSAVQQLLGEVWPRALKAVQAEEDALQAMRSQHGLAPGRIEPWDWRFWAEKVRRERFNVDDAEVKPYFALDRVISAAFDCAQRLFGLQFTPNPDLPVYHPDVRAYEVRNAESQLIGIFLQDNFARPNKRSGAWMSSLRMQTRNVAVGEAAQLPVILNNNNFAKGAADEPTLLSLDDARTLFHEFGHGLHGLLSDVTFERLSGTQVLRDFVELPSQIFEHWITEPEVLRQHARHWKTGEPMPAELMQRLARARLFNQGYETVRYTASAMADMAVHSLPEAEPPADLGAFEADLLQRAGLPHGVGLNHRLVHFQHLFSSSGYAAGYYVYLWAEVLDADGYDAFAEAGSPFDPGVASKLLRHVYSSGNSVEPGAAYAAFRGRAARVEPLLRKRGLLQAEPA
ncbi:MAG: M3 family metallopeptidase [Rubrivivax sp.]|nr:M3 family metallopeptidase [Rubrivivax sp.]